METYSYCKRNKKATKEREMKKIIAAAAGLALAGTMAVTATAAEVERPQITVKGDARVRMIMTRDFIDLAGINSAINSGIIPAESDIFREKDDFLNSRIRVTTKYKAKGGAYAIFRMRIADTTLSEWNGGRNSLDYDDAKGRNFRVDKAWIGVPVGPVKIEGGLTPVSVTRFTHFDEREMRLAAIYQNDGTMLKASYDKNQEIFGDTEVDFVDDDDKNTYSLQLNQDIGEDMKIIAFAAYQDDETDADTSGFIGSFGFFGDFGGVGVDAELIYMEDGGVHWGDTTTGDDDALGGYATVHSKFGDVAVKGTLGFTKDGYVVDRDYGYLMLGSYSPISMGNIGLSYTDTIWGAAVVGFKVSDKVKLTGNFVYLDGEIDDTVDLTMIEVSGQVDYAVSEGARLSAGLGLVDTDFDIGDETSYGAFGEMAITF